MSKHPWFHEAVKPLLDYLNKNHHPHTSVIVTNNSAELVEWMEKVIDNSFILD